MIAAMTRNDDDDDDDDDNPMLEEYQVNLF